MMLVVNQKCLFTLILKKTENKKQNIIYEIKKLKLTNLILVNYFSKPPKKNVI